MSQNVVPKLIVSEFDESEVLDRFESVLYEVCLLNLQKRKTKKTAAKPPIEWPLELIAIILDYLPQHQVYPFLSLSKGVDFIAKQRLFRQVYVFQYFKPFLHDAVDELLHWLFLTSSQLLHLMRHKAKWPGKVVMFDGIPWEEKVFNAIKRHLEPAEIIIPKALDSFDNYIDIKATQLPTSFDVAPHLARVTLVGSFFIVTLASLVAKVKVDNLLIFGAVKGIGGCIELSSVKQLSVVNAFVSNDDGNIFNMASQLNNLQDLYIAMCNLDRVRLDQFPKTIKRLAIRKSSCQNYCDRLVAHFGQLLEYLEFACKSHDHNWPRRLVTTNSKYNGYRLSGICDFPKLKLFVDGDRVYEIDRVLDVLYDTKQINYDPLMR